MQNLRPPTPFPSYFKARRHGSASLYAVIAGPVLLLLLSLAVDLTRVRLAKAELSTATDAAARYGASSLSNGEAAVQAAAMATAAANTVDGSHLVLLSSDVTVGTWDSATSTFAAGGASPNAVQVVGCRTSSRGNGIPLIFASIFGIKTCDLSITATTVLRTGSAAATARTDGIMNLWLAGMPAGSYGGSTSTGIAPDNSPVQVTGMTIVPGASLAFSASGSTADDPVNINQNWTPDGQPGGNRTNDTGYLNGMSQLHTQQGALIGVFLDNNAPTVGAAPANLNMNSSASRDYTSLSPLLKQPFFIGDGKTSGGTQQQIIVPAGATRLFLGVHDNTNWANNSGYFLVTINGSPATISLVK